MTLYNEHDTERADCTHIDKTANGSVLKPSQIKKILESPFILPMLQGIALCKRPSTIALKLKMSAQNMHYYCTRLIAAGLIVKTHDSDGNIVWQLTVLGDFILKDMLRRSVKHGTPPRNGMVPVRLHNISFDFSVTSDLGQLPTQLKWIELKNGVYKCNITRSSEQESGTVELIKSDKGCAKMQVHLPDQYFYDCNKGLIKRYDDARRIARLYAQRLQIEIGDRGNLLKRPHFAIENDIIAMYIASVETAEIPTEDAPRDGRELGKAWIDSSRQNAEIESNDGRYVHLYLQMPMTIEEVGEDLSRMKVSVERIERQTAGYQKYYHPTLTENN